MQSREATEDPWWAWALAITGALAVNCGLVWAAYRESLGPPARQRRLRPDLPPMLPIDRQVSAGAGYSVRDPARAWATAYTETELTRALRRYSEAGGTPVRVLDVSRQGGGPMAPHLSHREGRDVDLSLPPNAAELALLLGELVRSPGVEAIYLDHTLQGAAYEHASSELRQALQYPEPPHTGTAVVRHWPGHANHLHVRFYR